ncbi:hypothetical protein F511_07293 [Dorcoceras hygrometricum]|uniref:Uncharacterized protein n=1 Tax=Dorcoceras hygrometricum TaxID=472368 RepID=A0A2Z7B159_9LAMI|nr:hypothetical protein F511_07293 [Dorcoceras hygrometricum]
MTLKSAIFDKQLILLHVSTEFLPKDTQLHDRNEAASPSRQNVSSNELEICTQAENFHPRNAM